jgi:hypothetical protein
VKVLAPVDSRRLIQIIYLASTGDRNWVRNTRDAKYNQKASKTPSKNDQAQVLQRPVSMSHVKHVQIPCIVSAISSIHFAISEMYRNPL